MSETVLVTGGAGFIGSNVVTCLCNAGYEVVVLDNLSWGNRQNLEGLDVEFINGDIRNESTVSDAVKDVDGVFHLAGHVGNRRSIENPLVDQEINVAGTLNILEAIREHDPGKLVFSSSAAIFGEVKYTPVDESHPVEPDSPYGVTKLASEKHVLCYARLFDIDAVCLRYFNVYGPNQRYDQYGNVVPIWTHRLLNDEPLVIYGDGEQTRDFIDVRDVARANLQAFESGRATGPINIGRGEATTINTLADIFLEVANRDVDIEYREPRKGEVKHSVASVTKAEKTFDFDPTVNLQDGIETYVEWMRQRERA